MSLVGRPRKKTAFRLDSQMPDVKGVLRNFSIETTFHGFKRLWGDVWWRWPIWSLLIVFAISVCSYQIKNKMDVLVANPLTININVVYKEEIHFPAVTVCSKLKVRVSYMVNNTAFLKMLPIFNVVHSLNETLGDDELAEIKKQGEKYTAKQLYAEAGIPRDQLILWCRLPNGEDCSSADFEPVITAEGYCFRFMKPLVIREAGPSHSLKILFNLAQYERIPETPPTGVRIVVHDENQDPLPSTGYDVMPAYQTAVILKKTLSKQIDNCEPGNPLLYHNRYTYSGCRTEHMLTSAAMHCGCKPYFLPPPVYMSRINRSIDSLPDCSLTQHNYCIEKILQDVAVANHSTSMNRIISSSEHCLGECVREEYEKEIYYNVFRENVAFKAMIGSKDSVIRHAYERGRDAGAFLNLYRKIYTDYLDVLQAANGFNRLIVSKQLVPPYGTVGRMLVEHVRCLNAYLKKHVKGSNSTTKRAINTYNTSLTEAISKAVPKMDAKIANVDIDDLLKLAQKLKTTHLAKCSKDQEICSLAALYDLLKLRHKMEEKNSFIQQLRDEHTQELNELSSSFAKESYSLIDIDKKNTQDVELLRGLLEQYTEQVNLCLKQTGQMLGRMLDDGYPTMKSESLYHKFLNDLFVANRSILDSCKVGNRVTNSIYKVSDRKQLAEKIVHVSMNRNSSMDKTIKTVQFHASFAELMNGLEQKISAASYEIRMLNQSLYNMEAMDLLLDKYVNQSMDQPFRKSDFYEQVFLTNPPFQQALNHYKHVVTAQLIGLTTLIQSYLDKLIESYPGSESDLELLKSVISIDKSSRLSKATFESELGQVICLKKTLITLNNFSVNVLELEALDVYRTSVETLALSLKIYFDDLRSLKGFYQENLGLVSIYFRDMGIKEIEQTNAYDFFSFLCDVGGIVGLWLGGSLLSFFELFDLLCFQHLKRFGKYRRRKRPPPPPSLAMPGGSLSNSLYYDLPTGEPAESTAVPPQFFQMNGINGITTWIDKTPSTDFMKNT